MDRNQVLPSLRRGFLVGAVALAAVAATLAGLNWAHRTAWDMVQRARELGRLARDARALATDRETAIRGFLLSGKEASLEPEIVAKPRLALKLDSLITLSQKNVAQLERARAIREAVSRWDQGYATLALARARNGNPHASDADLAGKALFDNVRGSFDTFQRAEERLYRRLVAWDNALAKIAIVALTIELMLLFGVLLSLRKHVLGQATNLIEQQEQLEEQAIEMEAQTAELEEQTMLLEEQTDEARRTAHALEASNRELEATVARLEHSRTEVSAATRANQETLAILDVVLESAPIGFAFHDRDLRYTRINQALSAMSGQPAEKHFGRTPSEVYPDVGHLVEPVLREVLETGEPKLNVPISRNVQNGSLSEHHFLVSFFPIVSPDGITDGVGAVAIETTERRMLEEQLMQAQKMEAVGRLAGGIAHDFNNILTAIKSYSELLIDDLNAGNGRVEDVREIREAADRAANLTRQLLAFSRQQMLRPRVLDLNTTVRDLKNMLERLIGAHIQLKTKFCDPAAMVTADPGQIEQILLNLVVNARDAMPDGGRIDIETANVELDDEYARTHTSTPPGPYVMLSVSDTGSGMTREIQSRVFEPFFTTKDQGQGTGLGLSTVYGIVKQSGGSIWVYSEVGRGTTFKIYLPRVYEEADAPVEISTVSEPRGTETILLVEDEPSVREVASRILARNGYTVVTATNGADALRKCGEHQGRFDLIVTDIVMPEMGGVELSRRVRESQPNARILFTSGYTEDAVQRRSFLEPGAQFLEKPFTPTRLIQRAREVLDSRNGNGYAHDDK
jgi:PAS domain S-box-containing protein